MKHLDFTPGELEYMGKSIWDKSYLPVLYKFLELRDKMKVLDVGCGTGVLTRKLASQIRKGEVIGIDIDEKFLEYARKKSKEQNLKINYIKGDAYSLDFNDNYFDLVVCQKLLCNLDRPENALKEMIRVSKDKVVAIEPCNSISVEYCEDKRFLELLKLIRKAEAKSEKSLKEKNVDLNIGPKLPTMFYRNGLTDVEIKGYWIINILKEETNNSPISFEVEKLRSNLTEEDLKKINEFSKANLQAPKGSLQASPLFIVKGSKKLKLLTDGGVSYNNISYNAYQPFCLLYWYSI